MDEVTELNHIKDQVAELQGLCSEKEDKTKGQANTTDTLRSMGSTAKAEIDRTWKEIQQTTEQLKDEKDKQDKRVAAIIAEGRHGL